MKIRLVLLAAVNGWGVVPASSEERELGLSLASSDQTPTPWGDRPNSVLEPDQKTAKLPCPKEGEFETPEMIAAIEKNREDRERTVVMDR